MNSLLLQESFPCLLQNFNSLNALKKMFWSQLNYERVNRYLSPRNWTESVVNELKEDPLLLASGGSHEDFHVIYTYLKSEELSRQKERQIVNYLLKDHPYSLFVFSNKSASRWHFLNVKYEETLEKRKIFRRITIGEGEQLRTAIEQLSLLDLDFIRSDSPLDIQQRHDDALIF